MTSLARIEANRANAQLSTGPKTADGKAAAAVNATRHGIFAAVPVVRGESPVEWDAHRAGTLDALAPVGLLEATLAERGALLLWRLRRLARYEALTTAADQEDARLPGVDRVFTDTFSAATEPRTPPVEKAIRFARRKAADAKKLLASVGPAADYLAGLAAKSDDDPVPPAVADRVFREAFDAVLGYERAADPPEPGSRKLAAAVGHPGVKPAAVPWTAGLIRKGLEIYARHVGGSAGWLEAAVVKALAATRKVQTREQGKYEREAAGLAERRRRMRDWAAASALLPDPGRADRVMKYEAHLNKWLHATLHELQRMQAARSGDGSQPPVAVDVTIDVTGAPVPGLVG